MRPALARWQVGREAVRSGAGRAGEGDVHLRRPTLDVEESGICDREPFACREVVRRQRRVDCAEALLDDLATTLPDRIRQLVARCEL
ncbi:hypothetical protein MKK51_17760 [Methylobacterium sp. E-045]|nr:hypothetical protein [Methylobacterium sp. E-045]